MKCILMKVPLIGPHPFRGLMSPLSLPVLTLPLLNRTPLPSLPPFLNYAPLPSLPRPHFPLLLNYTPLPSPHFPFFSTTLSIMTSVRNRLVIRKGNPP